MTPPDPLQRFEQLPVWAREMLCRRLGLTPQQLRKLLSRRSRPAGWMCREIAEALDVPVQQLLRPDED